MACGSTKIEEQAPVTQETVPEEIVVEEPQVQLPEEPVVQEPVVEEEPEVVVDDAEYNRSVKKLANGESVSKDEFAADKSEILRLIDELQIIMNEKDYDSWLNYIAPDSIEFYSVPRKISRAGKTEMIGGLKDYFLDIFIPARKQSEVQEIRYISKSSIKAVHVEIKDNKMKITTYYNFVKIDGKWFVELPVDITIN